MSKEAATFDVEKEYGLDKYEKNEYVVLIFKEFRKYGKKLEKIALYETMEKDGKPLNNEMKELAGKKEQFQNHLKSLQLALDLFNKSRNLIPPKEEPKASKKEFNQELKNQITEACERTEKRLSYLFAIADTLQQKELLPNPFGHSTIPTPETKAAIKKLHQDIITIRVDHEITLAEEAKRIYECIHNFSTESQEGIDIGEARKPNFSEVASIVDQIAENKEISEMIRFKAFKKEDIHEKPKAQYQEAPAPKIQKEERKPEHIKEIPHVTKSNVQEVAKGGAWADEVDDEEEQKSPEKKNFQEGQEKKVSPAEPKPKPEDEFIIVKDKKDIRQERMEERRSRDRRRGGRGRQEGYGGEFRRRGRGPRRGGYRGRGGYQEGHEEAQQIQ
jgi:hypothetical protein